MIDGKATTEFVRAWISDYLESVGDDIRRLVSDRTVVDEIFSLPRRIFVDDEGTLSFSGDDRAFRLLEFGSSTLSVPALGLFGFLQQAMSEQVGTELAKGGFR